MGVASYGCFLTSEGTPSRLDCLGLEHQDQPSPIWQSSKSTQIIAFKHELNQIKHKKIYIKPVQNMDNFFFHIIICWLNSSISTFQTNY